jgi:transcriptional regulator with XRE-family HTH domain
MPTDRQLVALGLVIRRRRENLKISQEAFAASRHMGHSYYNAVERGNHNLTLWNLFRIAEGLGVSATQLLHEAEHLNVDEALQQPPQPPRRGRPRGSGRRF